MSLSIEVRQEADGAGKRILLTGTLDTETAPQLQSTIEKEITPDCDVVILDLKKLEFISSAGIQIVVRIKKMATANQAEFFLLNLQPQIRKVFEIIKVMDTMSLGVFSSVQEMDDYLKTIQDKAKQGE